MNLDAFKKEFPAAAEQLAQNKEQLDTCLWTIYQRRPHDCPFDKDGVWERIAIEVDACLIGYSFEGMALPGPIPRPR
jgi:hypothetical protein